MRGEAMERAGQAKEAVDLYVRAAVAEEDAHRPVRARLLWEQVGQRTGPSGMLLERLAVVCGRAHHDEDAFHYWVAAAARFHGEGRATDSDRARSHATSLKKRMRVAPAGREKLPLVVDVLRAESAAVRDLIDS